MLSKQAAYSHLGQMVQHERVVEGDCLLAGDNWEYSHPFWGITKTRSVPWPGVAGRTVKVGRLRWWCGRGRSREDQASLFAVGSDGAIHKHGQKGELAKEPSKEAFWPKMWAQDTAFILSSNYISKLKLGWRKKACFLPVNLQQFTLPGIHGMPSHWIQLSGCSRASDFSAYSVDRSILFWVSHQRLWDLLILIINNQNIIINKFNNHW